MPELNFRLPVVPCMPDARRRSPALARRCWPLLLCIGQAMAATVQLQVQGNDGKTLPDAVVFLESREARAIVKPATAEMATAEMAQKAKLFDPVVLVVPVGTSVTFPNRDTVRHHVYSFSAAKNFELKLYAGAPANPVLFDKPGIAVLGCNIHDAMAAWVVVVVETPYYGRSAKSGMVVLNQVPAGNYRLRGWHPSLAVGAPATDQPLVVGAADISMNCRLSGSSSP